MNRRLFLLASALFTVSLNVFGQGALNPTAAPGAMMKTLDQIEPRTPISTLPYTISSSGSYYVTTNIFSAGNGLTINASDVDLDLNGFSVIGTNTSTSGIFINGTRTNVSVRNGIIRNWASRGLTISNLRGGRFSGLRVLNCSGGIEAGSDAIVDDCTVLENGAGNYAIAAGENSRITRCQTKRGYTGIYISGPGLVRDCIVASNSNNGIQITGQGSIINSTTFGNQFGGIVVGERSTILGCVVVNTTNGIGISAGHGSIIRDTQSVSNSSHGLSASMAAVIEHCTVSENGGRGIMATTGSLISDCVVFGNTGHGIFVTDDCTVINNQVTSNGASGTDSGIMVNGTRTRVERNNATSNTTTGIRTASGGNFIVNNSAKANLANFVFTAGDTYGPTNVTTGSITNLNPYANFSY